MFKYNMFAIKGISDFPITDKSPILIETFMLQNRLNKNSPKLALVEDGKAGAQTFSALSVFSKSGVSWAKDLYPIPGQISKAAFDKLMTPSAYTVGITSIMAKFGAADLFECNKMMKIACYNLAIAITYFQQNNPKKGSLKSADSARFLQDIQPLIEKYNNYAKNMNSLYEGKGYFAKAVMWTDKDSQLRDYALPLEGRLTMLKSGDSDNQLVRGLTAASQKGFYPICFDIMESCYAVALFAKKYYTYSPPVQSPSGKDTPTDNGTPIPSTPPITTDSNPIDQVQQIVNVFMSLLPIGMIFVGIKVVANVVKGVDKNTKF